MSIAQVVQIEQAETNGPPVTLPPNMVTLALEGKIVKDRMAADKKRMDTLKDTFDTWFVANNTREATNAAGRVVAVRTHADPVKLDQKMIAKEFPVEFALCQTVQPWDSVSFR